ncbi:MAG: ATP-binding protein [Dehalococcoidia bacterium]
MVLDRESARGTPTQAAVVDAILDISADAGDLGATSERIARTLRTTFGVEHAAIGMIDLEHAVRVCTGFSSDAVETPTAPYRLSDEERADYERTVRNGVELFPDMDAVDTASSRLARVRGFRLRSVLRAAFALGDGLVGIVSVADREPLRLDERDAETLRTLSRAIAVALRQTMLRGELEQSQAALEAQARIFQAMGPGATLEGVAAVYVHEVRALFGASHAVVTDFTLRGPAVMAISSEHTTAEDYLAIVAGQDWDPEPALGAVIRGTPQIVADLALARRGPIEALAFDRGLRSLLRAPLSRTDGSVLGMVSVASTRPYAYNETHLARLVELTAALGVVAERAELTDESLARAGQVAALTRMLSTLNASASEAEIAQLFARELRQLIGADSVAIFAIDNDARMAHVIAGEAAQPEARPRRRERLDRMATYEGLLETAAARYDAAEPDAATGWLAAHAEARRFGSAVCVRLDGANGPAGAILAASARPGTLGEEQLRLLADVVPPLALVLGRARLVATLQEQTRRTDAILDLVTALAPQETLGDLGEPAAAALRAMFEADICIVSAVERGGLQVVGWDGAEGSSGAPLPALVEAHEWPLLHRARVTADLRLERRSRSPYSEDLRARGVRSVLEVLVGNPNARACMVTLGSFATRAYTQADGEQLLRIARPLEVAVEYLYGQREVARRASQLEAANRVLARLGAGGSPRDLARDFLLQCQATFECAHAVLLRCEGGAATVLGHVSSPAEPLAWGAPLEVEIAGADDPGIDALGTFMRVQGYATELRVPLLVRGEEWGAVSLWWPGSRPLDGEDRYLLNSFAGPLAIALERAIALDALAESERRYRSLVAQAEEMIFVLDPTQGTIIEANAFTSRTLGYTPEELIGFAMAEICLEPGLENKVRAVMEEGEIHLHEQRYGRKDGSVIYVDIVASLIQFGGRQCILAMARDVSDRRALQRQLMQAQKMESLGEMAGAVAHDFNNLLTTILGFAGILKLSGQMSADDIEHVALIEDAARRGAGLTSRLLSFARGGLVRFGPVDLGTLIGETLKLAAPTLSERCAVAWQPPARPVMVEGDEGQLQQAILNIILNARDAMPEGGDIGIRLEVAGSRAVLHIRDSGPGMDEETRMRIFEPFFTTKPAGSGTGLGMAITYGIVQGHHGVISVETEPGAGTDFRLEFPLLGPATAFADEPTGTLLLIDDDDLFRRTTAAALERLGFDVEEAANGADGIALLARQPGAYDAILLDLVMPGLSGMETYRALRRINPSVDIVVCTGYAADAYMDGEMRGGISGLLRKPFTLERLAGSLQEAGIALPRALAG